MGEEEENDSQKTYRRRIVKFMVIDPRRPLVSSSDLTPAYFDPRNRMADREETNELYGDSNYSRALTSRQNTMRERRKPRAFGVSPVVREVHLVYEDQPAGE